MFCIECGTQTSDNAKFCANCGKPISLEDTAASPSETPPVVDSQTANVIIQKPGSDVLLINHKTGETKYVKVGFAWVPFLFGLSLLGFPFWLRKMYGYGVVGLIATILCGQLAQSMMAHYPRAQPDGLWIYYAIYLIVSFFFGMDSNEKTARAFMKEGFEFYEPNSALAMYAKKSWKMEQVKQEE